LFSKPAGIEIAGSPAIFTGIVHKSLWYIFIGSSVFSPISKAVVGEVGANRTSKFLNALSNSLTTKVLIC
tara:strand:- start:134 stop:343 length:210 start_codon:yes stop_codon:yes gene_type:complete